jgi:hypothetical protein
MLYLRILPSSSPFSAIITSRACRALESPGVDHRLEWEAGFGLRVPDPFLWWIAYRGSAARSLPDGAFHHASTRRLPVEYNV